jgi:uncharacterized membrane protein YfcA
MILPWLGYLIVTVFLGLVGTGGSILILPILIYFFGLDIKVAITSSLFLIGSLALFRCIALIKYQLIDWKMVLLFGFPALLGTYFGATISSYNSGSMQLIFYIMLLLIGAILLFRKSDYINVHHEKHYWQVALDGIIIGIITSFVGVGGGFLIVPALILMAGLNLKNAIATSLIIIVIKSYFGFFLYLKELQQLKLSIDWDLLLMITMFGSIGLLLWHFFNHHLNQLLLKRIFSIALVISSLLILIFNYSDLSF